jgi:glycosyltransferase involved in cell wall biosynthesis
MRIVYVCADPGIPVLGGKGASVHVRSVTTALVERGHTIVLVCAKVGAGNPPPPVQELVVLDHDDDGQLRDVFNRWQPDAVIERYSLACGSARRVSAAFGIPLVLEVNAPLVLEAARYRNLGDRDGWLAYERDVFRSADAIGAVSRALVDYVADVAPAANAQWIPNGVDAELFGAARAIDLGFPAGSVSVGFAGSMKPWHGVAQLVDAIVTLPAVHLVLAGHGPERDTVDQRVAAHGLRPRVHWLGQLPHHRVASVLRALDIGAAPYLPADDFYFSPLKVLDYLAAGLPVVCPAIGDLPDLVGDAGSLYDPHEQNGLDEALRALVEDAERRRGAAAEATARSASLSWDANAAAYEQLIASAQPALSAPRGAR